MADAWLSHGVSPACESPSRLSYACECSVSPCAEGPARSVHTGLGPLRNMCVGRSTQLTLWIMGSAGGQSVGLLTQSPVHHSSMIYCTFTALWAGLGVGRLVLVLGSCSAGTGKEVGEEGGRCGINGKRYFNQTQGAGGQGTSPAPTLAAVLYDTRALNLSSL